MKKRTFLIIGIVIVLLLMVKTGSVLLNMLEISFDRSDLNKPYIEPEDVSEYPVYKSLSYYVGEDLLGAVDNKSWKLGFVDDKNNVIIPFEYTYPGSTYFSEGLAAVDKNVKTEFKTGYINKNNEVVIPFEYDYAEPFRDGCAIVKNNEKYGLIDKKGNTIIPLKYDNITALNTLNGYYYITENHKKGLVNFKGDIVVPIIYDELTNYCDTASTEKYLIAKKEDKSGVIDLNGNILIPFEYDYISVGSDTSVCVEKNGEYAVISLDGKTILPYGDKGYQAVGNGIIRRGDIFDRDFASIYNDKGEKILDEKKYKVETTYSNGTMVVVSSGGSAKTGLIDFSGKLITKLKYDKITPLDSNHFKIEKNGKFGILDVNGEEYFLKYKLKDIMGLDKNNNILAVGSSGEYVYVISESGVLLKCYMGKYIYEFNNSYIIEKENLRSIIVSQ